MQFWYNPISTEGNPHVISTAKINSLPNDKFLDLSKLKTFADDYKCNLKAELLIRMGRKHCGERRKCWSPAFSPFHTVFSKAFFCRVVKSMNSVVKS